MVALMTAWFSPCSLLASTSITREKGRTCSNCSASGSMGFRRMVGRSIVVCIAWYRKKRCCNSSEHLYILETSPNLLQSRWSIESCSPILSTYPWLLCESRFCSCTFYVVVVLGSNALLICRLHVIDAYNWCWSIATIVNRCCSSTDDSTFYVWNYIKWLDSA